jgi:hypothetical protein
MIITSLLIIILVTALPSFFKILPENCYNRISAIILLFSVILTFKSLLLKSIGSGIAIYGGLFHITVISQFMDIVLFTIVLFLVFKYIVFNANYLFIYEEENYKKYFRLSCKVYNNSFESSDNNKKYIICKFEGEMKNNSELDSDDELYSTSTSTSTNNDKNRNITSSTDLKVLESESKIKTNEFGTEKEQNSKNLVSNLKNIQTKEQEIIPGLDLNTYQEFKDKKISFSKSKSKSKSKKNIVWDSEQEVEKNDVSYHIDPEALSNAKKNKKIPYEESMDLSIKKDPKNIEKVTFSANDDTVTFIKNSPPSSL